MTGFNHGLTGAVIALTIKVPALAVPIAFVGHYFLDLTPHQDYFTGGDKNNILNTKFKRFLVFDFSFSVFLMIVLALMFPSHKWLIWSCMVASAIPDSIFWFYRKGAANWPKGLDPFTQLHRNINNHRPHFYFDISYFLAMTAVILLIKY